MSFFVIFVTYNHIFRFQWELSCGNDIPDLTGSGT